MFFAYNFLMTAGLCAAAPLLVPWIAASAKRRATFPRRLAGAGSRCRPPRRPVWVHALSVGEVMSAAPLVAGLADAAPKTPLVFSTATLTGLTTARQMLQKQAAHIFLAPYDLLPVVRNTCRRLQPGAVIIVETDIWPNWLSVLQHQGVPAFLVNTRLSERSFRGYRRLAFFMGPVFDLFAHICPQTPADAERLQQLGVSRSKITVTGNLKYDQVVAAPAAEKRRALLASLALPPDSWILVAGSTHPGEERMIAEAFRKPSPAAGPFSLIVAPRDPRRAGAVRRLFSEHGFRARCLHSETAEAHPCSVVVIDAIGLLRSLYDIGHAAFVGGSLVEKGGHNPLEPAALAKPVLFGPHMTDFPAVSEALLASEGARQVRSAVDLRRAVERIAGDDALARRMGAASQQTIAAHQGAADKTLAVIRRCLKAIPNGRTWI